MARGKYEEWLTDEGLLKLEGWARDGLTNEQIAKNIGVSRKTLQEWIRKYSDIGDTLKKGKEVVDREVENALLKRALGYQYVERKYEYATMSDEEYAAKVKAEMYLFKLENPEASLEKLNAVEKGISRYKKILVEEKTKEVAPDTTAQIFWLKNRRPNDWRNKDDVDVANTKANTELTQLKAKLIKGAEHDFTLMNSLLQVLGGGNDG